MFSSPFDEKIAFVALNQKETSSCIPDLDDNLPSTASKKRKEEFTLGRTAAHLALERLGLEPPPAISRGESGEPLWPSGIVGSITHTSGHAIAALAERRHYKSIGIDLEYLGKDLKYDISKRIALPQEQEWIDEECELSAQRTIILFSAKESIYKALFPLCRIPLSFKDVSLNLDSQDFSFTVTLHIDLGPHFQRNSTFNVGYSISNNFVFTYLDFKS